MTAGMARVALYWAPALDDPLHALGSAWLGRDAETGAALPQPAVPGMDLAEVTAEARRYGLHATLKPPFRLAAPYPALCDAASSLAARTAPFMLPPLRLESLGGFLALVESTPSTALRALCDSAVESLDPCRAPPSEAEIARRRPERLGPSERANLERWGYPYVFGEWRFHVTLTRRLDAAEMALLRPALEAHLGGVPSRPRQVTELAIFTQAAPDAPFLIAERLPLGG